MGWRRADPGASRLALGATRREISTRGGRYMTHRGYTYVRASGPAPGSAAYFGQGQTAPAAQPAASGYAHSATPVAAREEASAAATPLVSSGLGFLPGSPQY